MGKQVNHCAKNTNKLHATINVIIETFILKVIKY